VYWDETQWHMHVFPDEGLKCVLNEIVFMQLIQCPQCGLFRKTENVCRNNCHYLFPLSHTECMFPICITQLWMVMCSSGRLSRPAASSLSLSLSLSLMAHNRRTIADYHRATLNNNGWIGGGHTGLLWAETWGVPYNRQYSLLIEWEVSLVWLIRSLA